MAIFDGNYTWHKYFIVLKSVVILVTVKRGSVGPLTFRKRGPLADLEAHPITMNLIITMNNEITIILKWGSVGPLTFRKRGPLAHLGAHPITMNLSNAKLKIGGK